MFKYLFLILIVPGERKGGISKPLSIQACSLAKFLLLFSTLKGSLPANMAYMFTPLKKNIYFFIQKIS